jgi:hypothetical protein
MRPRKAVKIAKAPKAVRRNPMDDFIAAGARMLDLKIDKAWLAAVRSHLGVTMRHGAQVMDFTLPDDSEPAPVFRS